MKNYEVWALFGLIVLVLLIVAVVILLFVLPDWTTAKETEVTTTSLTTKSTAMPTSTTTTTATTFTPTETPMETTTPPLLRPEYQRERTCDHNFTAAYLDIALIIDVTGNLTEPVLASVRSFLVNFFGQFRITQEDFGVRVGLTLIDPLFSSFQADLGTYSNNKVLATVLRSLALSSVYGTGSRITLGLRDAQQMMENQADNRNYAPDVVLLMTSSGAIDKADAETTAGNLHRLGARLFVVRLSVAPSLPPPDLSYIDADYTSTVHCKPGPSDVCPQLLLEILPLANALLNVNCYCAPNGGRQFFGQCVLTAGLIAESSYADARSACFGTSTLVHIHAADKNAFINDIMVSANVYSYWLGLKLKPQSTDHYTWDVDTGQMTQDFQTGDFSAWANGMPDTERNQRECVVARYSQTANRWFWFSEDCTAKHAYVCQRHAYDTAHFPSATLDQMNA